MRGLGRRARLPRAAAADDEVAGASTSPRSSTSSRTRDTSTSSSTGWKRFGGRPSMPDLVASGKVREIYALDDERLLLVASDRISTFDVVLPTEVPDKGRVLTGLSAFWFARTAHICANHLIAMRPDGRSTECRRLEMLPLECVVRGYLAGSGWKDYQASGAVCGHALPEACANRIGSRADLHSCDEGHGGARREHRRRESDRARRRGALPRASSGSRSSCTSSPRSTRQSAASSSPTRSSSSGSTETGASCSPTRRSRPTRPGSGRRTTTRPADRSRPSTSSSSATTARRSAGTRRLRDPSSPRTSSPARAPLRRGVRALTGIGFDVYLADPEVVLR